MSIITKKTVLITGCSASGIGAAMVHSFNQRGYHVFATLRDTTQASHLSSLSDVDILELDVTIPATIDRCRDTISARTNGKLDILVNNAGVEFIRPLLDTTIAQAKELYDINVWGPLAMIQAFAPLLIQAKGIIINQGSIDSALSMVWAGIFASSKAAFQRMSETLRNEIEPLGVRVVTIVSGSTDTPMFDKSGQMSLPESSYYFEAQAAAYQERVDHRKSATKVDVQAENIVKKVLGGAIYPVWTGSFAALVRFITWALPIRTVDGLLNAARGIKEVKRL